MSVRPPVCRIPLLKFKDLTERGEISWLVNPMEQAFVSGVSPAVFGKGLGPGTIWRNP